MINRHGSLMNAAGILITFFLMSGFVIMAGSGEIEIPDWITLNNTFLFRHGDTTGGNYTFNNTNMTIIGDLNVTGNWYGTNFTVLNYQTFNITEDLNVLGNINASGYTGDGSWLDLEEVSSGLTIIPNITDNGDGTVSLTVGEVMISSNPYFTGLLYNKSVRANNSVSLTLNSMNFIYAGWNSGSPVYQATTNRDLINNADIVPVMRVYMNDTAMKYNMSYGDVGLGYNGKDFDRIMRTRGRNGVEVESGFGLGESGTRTITIGSGVVWRGVERKNLDAVNSGVAKTELYYHAGGNWVNSDVTTYNNTHYDDGTNTIELTPNRYAVVWVYRRVYADEIDLLLGGGDYTLNQALDSSEPLRPDFFDYFYTPIGRIIVKKNSDTASAIQNVVVDFGLTPSSVQDHNDLSNIQGGSLSEYYHLNNSEYGELTGFIKVANLTNNGNLSVVNLSANYFIGDGSRLYNVNASGGGIPSTTQYSIQVGDDAGGWIENDGILVKDNIINSTSSLYLMAVNKYVNIGAPGANNNGEKLIIWRDSTGTPSSVNISFGAGIFTVTKDKFASFDANFYKGNIYSSSSSLTIGKAGTLGAVIYAKDISAEDIFPRVNVSYNLGTTSLAWNNTYTKTLWEGSAGEAKGGLSELKEIDFTETNIETLKDQFPDEIKKKVTILNTEHKVIQWLNATIGTNNYIFDLDYECDNCDYIDTVMQNVTWDYTAQPNETITTITDRTDITGQQIELTNNDYIHQFTENQTYLSVFDEIRMTQNAVVEANDISVNYANKDYNDIAEYIPCNGNANDYENGDLVCADNLKVTKCNQQYDTKVIGVVNHEPSFFTNEPNTEEIPIVLKGAAAVKVDCTGSSISVGDLLVSSNTNGMAQSYKTITPSNWEQVYNNMGSEFGKALQACNDEVTIIWAWIN